MALKLTGGSVSFSIAVFAVALTIRSLRDRQRRRDTPSLPTGSSSKYYAELSLEAVALLVHLQAVPYCIIDVRAVESAAAAPLASWVAPAVNIPEPQVAAALKNAALWHSWAATSGTLLAAPKLTQQAADNTAADSPSQNQQQPGQRPAQQQQCRGLPMPSRSHVLVVVADGQQQQQLAVSRLAAAGFDRVMGLSCNLITSPGSSKAPDLQDPAAAAASVQFPVIHADALAVLLGVAPVPDGVWQIFCQRPGLQNPLESDPSTHVHHSSSHASLLAAASGAAVEGSVAGQQQQRLLLLDVRRHDERTLYGAIPGALHIPADELPSALLLQSDGFRSRYHFERPQKDLDVLVLHSRISARARWGAQICVDAGCSNVMVYQEGVSGWHFSPNVDAYEAFQQGERPPEPEAGVLCEPDVAAGLMDLQRLNLLDLLKQQQSMP